VANPKIGNVEIVPLLDIEFSFPFSNVFPDVPASAWEPYERLYPKATQKGNYLTNASVYALRAGGQTVIVDAGIGPGAGGKLDADLRAKGIDRAEVDVVIFTHLHPDHVGWAVRDGKAFFSKARHVIPKADWEYFRSPGQAAQNQHVAAMEPLAQAGAIELVEGEKSVTPELTLLPTPGHTPGHQSILIASAGERAYVVGDVVHHPAQLQETAWCPDFDADKVTSTASRRKLLDRLESEGCLFAACHFPAPGLGRIAVVDGRRSFKPL